MGTCGVKQVENELALIFIISLAKLFLFFGFFRLLITKIKKPTISLLFRFSKKKLTKDGAKANVNNCDYHAQLEKAERR